MCTSYKSVVHWQLCKQGKNQSFLQVSSILSSRLEICPLTMTSKSHHLTIIHCWTLLSCPSSSSCCWLFSFVFFPLSCLWCPKFVKHICFFPRNVSLPSFLFCLVYPDKILKNLDFCIRLSLHPLPPSDRTNLLIYRGKTDVDCHVLWLNSTFMRMNGCFWRQKMV